MNSILGQKFGVDGHLEVIGFGAKSASRKTTCIVHCHICAKDHELFGDGNFKILQASLKRGCIPCGCSVRPTYTEEQYKVLINRVCSQRSYTFIGYVGDFIGNRTKVKVTCQQDGNVWETNIERLLRGDGCLVCAVTSRTKSDGVMIESFMSTGAYLEGTEFWRSRRKSLEGKLCYWHYTCPVCSNDKYVKDGLCSGVFEARSNCLQRGSKSCRCPHSFGFDVSLPSSIYVLRVKGDSSCFTGYGISNVLQNRMATHRRSLAANGFSIESSTFFDISGVAARNIEAAIKGNFIRLPQEVDGFKTEATLYEEYENVVSFVEESVSVNVTY